jgi:hypothetical protein
METHHGAPHILSIRHRAENHLRTEKQKNCFLAQNGSEISLSARDGQFLATWENELSGLNQAGDLNHRKRLPMTVLTTYVLAPSEFLDDKLLGAKLVDDFTGHLSTRQGRNTDFCGTVLGGHQQDLGKHEFVTRFTVTAIDPYPITFTNAELMTAFFNDRVHPSKTPRPGFPVPPTRLKRRVAHSSLGDPRHTAMFIGVYVDRMVNSPTETYLNTSPSKIEDPD